MRRAAVIVVLAFSACVAPTRGFEAFEGKAVDSVRSVTSSVETTRMAIDSALGSEGTAAYLSRTISDAEEEAAGAEGSFATIQPPDARSDALREEVSPLLSSASDLVEDARIAMRRSDIAALSELAGELAKAAQKLHDFLDAHQ